MPALALLNLIKDNRRGLAGAFAVMIAGLVLMGLATLLLDRRLIGGFAWMALVGLGAYLAYVPFGSMLFDRLIASTRAVGTAVFAIYLADAIGYTGSVGTMIFKDKVAGGMSRLDFLRTFTYFLSLLGAVLLAGGAVYFLRRGRRDEDVGGEQP
jgi:LPXTG-motif cell wall-anchored protein